jgi:hypothetical protein
MSGGKQTRDANMCVVARLLLHGANVRNRGHAPESASTGIGRGNLTTRHAHGPLSLRARVLIADEHDIFYRNSEIVSLACSTGLQHTTL